MPCYHPLTGYLSSDFTVNGKRKVVFDSSKGFVDRKITVPCGKCIGCRLERSKMWAVRCLHEASMHDNNCFITLTIDNSNIVFDNVNNLDRTYTLIKSDFQLFMKRLRKKYGQGIRYFHCGEYGSLLSRPHHHACLFGFDFPDKYLWSIKNGIKLYRSDSLEKLWRYGFSTIGEVNFESAAYVARYVVKKINGDKKEEHYSGREPEYITMSRKPGIGKNWLDKYKDDVYNFDELIIKNGIKVKVPRYYDDIISRQDSKKMIELKSDRIKKNENNPSNIWRQLQKRELLQKKNLGDLKRGFENG